jgi:hypothetical protein
LANHLLRAGVNSFDALKARSEREIEMVCPPSHLQPLTTFGAHNADKAPARVINIGWPQIVNRNPPFGNQVKDAIKGLPQFELIVRQVNATSECFLECVLVH